MQHEIPIEIPIAQPLKKCSVCARCSQYFVPPSDTKKGSAKFYRCGTCLSTSALVTDYVNSCSVS